MSGIVTKYELESLLYTGHSKRNPRLFPPGNLIGDYLRPITFKCTIATKYSCQCDRKGRKLQ